MEKVLLCLNYLIRNGLVFEFFEDIDQIPSYVKREMCNIIAQSNPNTVSGLVAYLKEKRIIAKMILPEDEAWKEMEEILR